MLVQPCQLQKSCSCSGVIFLRLVQHGSCKSPREVLGNLCTEVHGNLASRLEGELADTCWPSFGVQRADPLS